ncbi:Fmc1 protein [Saccharomycopsis crataegensis]|uniref:Fmc1 protein n=1 Tax=Saccharomycopsis crataegensis TaxID=43959 RepID=A0AAV5QJA5_9ASCO|nr:Fmc1 protein [Saccharomycopsis crataegensis]
MSSATLRSNYRRLYRELLRQNKRIYELHKADESKKHDALLKYQRINLIRDGKRPEEIDQIMKIRKDTIEQQQLKEKLKGKFINSLGFADNNLRSILHLKDLEEQSAIQLTYITETFLKSQRTYEELVQRYNPGMTMSQEEKVKKTARRVGLDVPDAYN